MGSGFVLAIPVFFDTVFYLLVPLARSLYRKTGVNYLLYILAIGAGGAITHTLVPPTPGPLYMAAELDFPVGVMLLVGLCVALPAAFAALLFARILNRVMPVPMRQIGSEPEPKKLSDEQLPSLWLSLLPVLLPVLLITSNTVLNYWVESYTPPTADAVSSGAVDPTRLDPEAVPDLSPADVGPPVILRKAFEISAIVGNANFALLLSAVVALLTLLRQGGLSRVELAAAAEVALMSGGVIILITAGGGAFGEMLKVAGVGQAIQSLFAGVGATGIMILLLGFCLAAVLKIAQGSSTVAMITGSSMLAGVASFQTLGFHPVYLATAIGAGSLVVSWMNDSGFWIFAKMSGLTEVEALKSWTTTLLVLAVVSLAVTMLLAFVLPDPLGFISPQVSTP
jgi:GntP family gluconate:H+ symporter